MNYLMGWFAIDVVSCFPFDLILPDNNINEFARLAKLPRLIRLFRLVKLIQVLRLFKAKKKYSESFSTYMKLKPSIERIFLTFGISFMIFHIVACIWHITTVFDEDNPASWK